MRVVWHRKLLFLLVLVSLFEAGAADLFESPLTAESRVKVENIFRNISTYHYVKCRFSQDKLIKRLNRTLTSTGRMLFDSEKGIAWIVEKPFPTTTVLTDRAMIQRGSGGQERVLSAGGNETFHRFSLTVQSLFLGQTDIIINEYELFYRDGEEGRWKIGLIPRDSTLKGIVSAFELEGTDFIDSFFILESGGDTITYSFSDHVYPDELSEEENSVFP